MMAGGVHFVDADKRRVVRDILVVPDAIFERLLEIEIPILEEAVEIVAQSFAIAGRVSWISQLTLPLMMLPM